MRPRRPSSGRPSAVTGLIPTMSSSQLRNSYLIHELPWAHGRRYFLATYLGERLRKRIFQLLQPLPEHPPHRLSGNIRDSASIRQSDLLGDHHVALGVGGIHIRCRDLCQIADNDGFAHLSPPVLVRILSRIAQVSPLRRTRRGRTYTAFSSLAR
jgi:hypothetical protein